MLGLAALLLLIVSAALFLVTRPSSPDKRLIAGVRQSELEEVKAALEAGANPNLIVEETRETILAYALNQNKIPAALLLIEKGATLEGRTQIGETLLNAAIRWRSAPLVKAILEKDAAAITKAEQPLPGQEPLKAQTRNSPLIAALILENEQIVKLLLQHGAPVNKRYERGQTPLILAARLDSSFVKLLLEKGADPAIKDESGKTALDYARQLKRQQAVLAIEQWIKKHG